MKTFKQFMEQQKTDVPDIIKSLQGIAQTAGKTIDPKSVKNKVVGTVFNKLTGGAEGREKMTNKIKTVTDKMSKEMPGKFNEFDKFLKSGTIERGFEKLGSQLKKTTK
tara:strand:+ start:146 stop:469 length:324 start_codon:yes stop_codon:yes gene_type:complete